ncbi:MAG TPA: PDZ domain-containing protein [Thermoanaerobaculia bacterium]|nr:PDZ domain-containing protein [Thermoanaerobaculia bacterium]
MAGAQPAEIKKCNATAQECERAIRQMLSGRRYVGLQLMELSPGLAVKTVVDNGPADQAGIRPGDRFIVVNGKSTRDATIKDFKVILSEAKQTGRLWVIVLRHGILKQIDVRMQPYSEAQIDKIIAQHLAEFQHIASKAPSQ